MDHFCYVLQLLSFDVDFVFDLLSNYVVDRFLSDLQLLAIVAGQLATDS
jgi:hypothetical protein